MFSRIPCGYRIQLNNPGKKLQQNDYLSFFLQCATVFILGATAHHIYFLLKMCESSINDLVPGLPYDLPESDVRRQKLIDYVVTGNSKHYMGKACTEERINKLSAEEVDKLFGNYEANSPGRW